MNKDVLDDKTDVRNLLMDFCERNTPAEIHYGPADDIRSARARMLAVDEDFVCTDEPQNVEDGVSLRTGDAVRVFMLKEGMRFGFDSRVRNLRRRIRLNEHRSITGMALQMPAQIRSEQRRRDYRVSLMGYNLVCTVSPESANHPGACDLLSTRITTNFANISARGAGLVFHKNAENIPTAGDPFFLEFKLPEEEGIFIALAEARHARPIPGHDSIIVGMRILPNECLQAHQTRNRLAKFVTSEQRRMLRRRK